MTAITRSRLVTVLALAAAVGCSEPFDTPPNEPSQPGTGLIVIPQNATIRAGQVVALKATLRDQYGNQLVGMTVSWKSSNEGVASVAPNGEVLGLSAGAARVTAEADGKTQSSGIQVLPRQAKPTK
jgi:uncharacterized protein YjdB